MKRILTIFLLSSLYTLSANAQKMGVDLGIKIGGNFNQVNGDYWENGYKANLLGGAYLGVQGPKFGVQLEGLFSQSTFVTGNGFYDIYQDFYNNAADSAKGGSFKVNYLSIPVLLNIKFSKVKLQLGPQYSGVVSVRDKDELLTDAKSLFKSGSLDGVVGLWIDLPARFNVGARYIVGLSNINGQDGAVSAGNQISDAWRQKTLQVHLGYGLF